MGRLKEYGQKSLERKRYDWRPLERERVKALMSQDARKYARLCYELGVEAEDKELYTQGALPEYKCNGLEKVVDEAYESIIPLEKGKRRKRSVSNSIYSKFYEEGSSLKTSPWEDTDEKMVLLEKYFPIKGNTGNMSPRQIGSKFTGMLKYAKKRIAEQTR